MSARRASILRPSSLSPPPSLLPSLALLSSSCPSSLHRFLFPAILPSAPSLFCAPSWHYPSVLRASNERSFSLPFKFRLILFDAAVDSTHSPTRDPTTCFPRFTQKPSAFFSFIKPETTSRSIIVITGFSGMPQVRKSAACLSAPSSPCVFRSIYRLLVLLPSFDVSPQFRLTSTYRRAN